MNLSFKRLDENAILPTRAHPYDAGLDLYALEGCVVGSGDISIVRTGLAVEIPYGYVGLVHPRSGLAFKHGITVVNAPGTIDSSYRGELQVALTMLEWDGNCMFENHPVPLRVDVNAGDRIAQLVVQKIELPYPIEVDEMDDTDRGSGGFGSTGR